MEEDILLQCCEHEVGELNSSLYKKKAIVRKNSFISIRLSAMEEIKVDAA